MAYKVNYKNSVKRDLKTLNREDAVHILDQLEDQLATHPEEYPMLKGDFAGLRKFRVGDYRVIFAVFDEEVLILRIGHRKEVYR